MRGDAPAAATAVRARSSHSPGRRRCISRGSAPARATCASTATMLRGSEASATASSGRASARVRRVRPMPEPEPAPRPHTLEAPVRNREREIRERDMPRAVPHDVGAARRQRLRNRVRNCHAPRVGCTHLARVQSQPCRRAHRAHADLFADGNAAPHKGWLQRLVEHAAEHGVEPPPRDGIGRTNAVTDTHAADVECSGHPTRIPFASESFPSVAPGTGRPTIPWWPTREAPS